MATDVDRILLNAIPQKYAQDPDPEIRDFWITLTRILWQLRTRTGGDSDNVAFSSESIVLQDGGNRTYRRFQDEIQELKGIIVELKRSNRRLEQRIYDIESSNDPFKSIRRLESEINELTMRIDSGV